MNITCREMLRPKTIQEELNRAAQWSQNSKQHIVPQFQCMECGKKYRKPRETCTKCGGCDIDLST